MYEYRAKVLKVVDGDTVHLEIDLGLETFRRIKCRLHGINAPELNTLEGKASRSHLVGLLENAFDNDRWIGVTTHKDRQEKYGRYLVTLADLAGKGENLNYLMIEHGHAKAYMEDK